MKQYTGFQFLLLSSSVALGKASTINPRQQICNSYATSDTWCAGPVYTQDMRPPLPDGSIFKALSWNVVALRNLLKKVWKSTNFDFALPYPAL